MNSRNNLACWPCWARFASMRREKEMWTVKESQRSGMIHPAAAVNKSPRRGQSSGGEQLWPEHSSFTIPELHNSSDREYLQCKRQTYINERRLLSNKFSIFKKNWVQAIGYKRKSIIHWAVRNTQQGKYNQDATFKYFLIKSNLSLQMR